MRNFTSKRELIDAIDAVRDKLFDRTSVLTGDSLLRATYVVAELDSAIWSIASENYEGDITAYSQDTIEKAVCKLENRSHLVIRSKTKMGREQDWDNQLLADTLN